MFFELVKNKSHEEGGGSSNSLQMQESLFFHSINEQLRKFKELKSLVGFQSQSNVRR
jgi:hypothetical protein